MKLVDVIASLDAIVKKKVLYHNKHDEVLKDLFFMFIHNDVDEGHGLECNVVEIYFYVPDGSIPEIHIMSEKYLHKFELNCYGDIYYADKIDRSEYKILEGNQKFLLTTDSEDFKKLSFKILG